MDADTLIARALGRVEATLLQRLPDPAAGDAWLARMRPALRRYGRAWLKARRGKPLPRTPRQAAELFRLLARTLDLLGPPSRPLLPSARAPRCGLCLRARGTSPGCDRCQAFVRFCREPIPRSEIDSALAADRARQAPALALAEARFARLRGRTIRVGLVGCGKAKAAHASPAKELYVGRLFRAARAFAEHTCDEWVILSALHGVLQPDHVIQPYEQTLRSLRNAERASWEQQVRARLKAQYDGLDVQYVGLAGEDYLDAVPEVREIERPLRGLGIGQRIKFLESAVRDRAGNLGDRDEVR